MPITSQVSRLEPRLSRHAKQAICGRKTVVLQPGVIAVPKFVRTEAGAFLAANGFASADHGDSR